MKKYWSYITCTVCKYLFWSGHDKRRVRGVVTWLLVACHATWVSLPNASIDFRNSLRSSLQISALPKFTLSFPLILLFLQSWFKSPSFVIDSSRGIIRQQVLEKYPALHFGRGTSRQDMDMWDRDIVREGRPGEIRYPTLNSISNKKEKRE